MQGAYRAVSSDTAGAEPPVPRQFRQPPTTHPVNSSGKMFSDGQILQGRAMCGPALGEEAEVTTRLRAPIRNHLYG